MEMDLLRGRTLLESGRPAEALPLLDGFLGPPSRSTPQALVCRARALTETRAARRRRSPITARPSSAHPLPEPDLVQECADALAAQGCDKEAVQVLAAGHRKVRPDPVACASARWIWKSRRKISTAALSRVEAMRQSAPRPEPWMAKRASILAQAGRIQESRAAWQALVEHLAALPNLERGSHAMSKLAAEAKQALAALDSLPATTER